MKRFALILFACLSFYHWTGAEGLCRDRVSRAELWMMEDQLDALQQRMDAQEQAARQHAANQHAARQRAEHAAAQQRQHDCLWSQVFRDAFAAKPAEVETQTVITPGFIPYATADHIIVPLTYKEWSLIGGAKGHPLPSSEVVAILKRGTVNDWNALLAE